MLIHCQSTICFFRGWNELEWDTVNTVSLVSRRVEPLPFEHVAQMSVTSSTRDLNSPPIRIRCSFYGSRKSFIKCWPTTPRIELCRWFVQGGSAPSTSVNTLVKELVILTCSRIPENFILKWDLITVTLLLVQWTTICKMPYTSK